MLEIVLAVAGVQEWLHLPCWLAENFEHAGILVTDTSKVLAAGLRCRPVEQTVADTWRWVQQAGLPTRRPGREPGLPIELEWARLGGPS